MPSVIVLGAGMVGSVMAADMAKEKGFRVTIADARPDALERAAALARRTAPDPAAVATVRADLSDTRVLARTIQPFDIVLGALSSAIGFASLRAVIEAGKNFCDICFMREDFLELDALARERGVTAVCDCGVAPGMSNMAAGYAAAVLDPCDSIAIYVGGLPRERRWPFQYKAAFSPRDVVEEYTRPSRIVERGEVVVREALSEPELLEFDHIGTLEAFNTDGLRSLATTLRARPGKGGVPNMKEKTMRYPGHIELMRVFRHTGLFGEEPIRIGAGPSGDGGTLVRPIDVISALMFPKWTYGPGEEDLTVMRIVAEGTQRQDAPPLSPSPSHRITVSPSHGAQRVRLTWDLYDTFDRQSGMTSMSRTTAFPCTIMARLVAAGKFRRPGVIPPETVGAQPGMLDHFLEELSNRGVRYTSRTEALE